LTSNSLLSIGEAVFKISWAISSLQLPGKGGDIVTIVLEKVSDAAAKIGILYALQSPLCIQDLVV